MIRYEVKVVGKDEIWHKFDSQYQYKEGERLFVQHEEKVYSLTVARITHNCLGATHIVRLNCHSKEYEKEQ